MSFRNLHQLEISPLTISGDIAEAREKAAFSLSQLAKKMGIRCRTVRQHESGITLPDLRSLQRYADALNVELVIKPRIKK